MITSLTLLIFFLFNSASCDMIVAKSCFLLIHICKVYFPVLHIYTYIYTYTYIFFIMPVQKVSSHAIWKRDIYWRRYKKHCTQDNDTSILFKVGILGPHTVLPASLATATRCSFCSGSWSHRINFAMTCFMPRTCLKILGTVFFGIPRSASSSCTVSHQSLLIAAGHIQHSQVFFIMRAFQNVDHFQQNLTILEAFVPHVICTALIALSLKAFWIIWIVSVEECSSLTQILIQIPCSTQSFRMWWPHSTHVHSTVSTAPTD